MKANFSLFAMLGLANAELVARQTQTPGTGTGSWHPITNNPEFFSLRVDTSPLCRPEQAPVVDEDGNPVVADCTFENYAIRLDRGNVVATPYNRWWDPRLPMFFVDDDTKMYTVSKEPLQLFIDLATGALRYGPLGWLPPNSVAISFYKTGDNPLGVVSPSPAYLSWPSTQGISTFAFGDGPWWLCPIGPGRQRQWRVFINNGNFGASNEDLSSDVSKDTNQCRRVSLAAINANPFRNTGSGGNTGTAGSTGTA